MNGNTYPGVDPTGVTECSAALQACLDENTQIGDTGYEHIVSLNGKFNIASTIYIKGSVDALNCVFNYSGSGTAIQIGTSDVGQLTRLNIKLGYIRCTTKPNPGWVSGTVGLTVQNVFRSTIQYQHINGFETGLLLLGDGSYGMAGSAYNTYQCGTLNNNKVNQKLLGTTGTIGEGWATQNTFIGGCWAHGEGTYGANGQRNIVIGDANGGAFDNNTWLNACLEGSTEEYIIESFGAACMWIGCHWETVGHAPQVYWHHAESHSNLIIGGTSVDDINFTRTTGSSCNNVIGYRTMHYDSTADGGIVLSNDTGGVNAPLAIMSQGYEAHGYTVAANYTSKLLPGSIRLRNAVDSANQDRLILDGVNRAITLGAGVNSNTRKIAWGDGSPEGAVTASVGSLYLNYGSGLGLFRKVTGTGNTGWQVLGQEPIAYASRPTASAAGIGGMYFDTTLRRPCWSDGTHWRDSNGHIVDSADDLPQVVLNQPSPTDRVDITVLDENFATIETRLNVLAAS